MQTVESGECKGLRLIYVRGPDAVTIEFLQLPEDAPNQATQHGVVEAGATAEVHSVQDQRRKDH
jgi:hypothetical protein